MSSQGSTLTGTDDTGLRLEEWGKWVRSGRVDPVLVCPAMFGLGSTVPTAQLTDDEALLIDSAVARLKRRDRQLGDVILLAYVDNKPDYKIARIIGCHRNTVRQLRMAGVAWIDGVLDAAQRD